MSYRVLARRWRPADFSSMVGQEHVVRALSNALKQDRLHHACLFTGTRGVGKTTLARILAKCLNCARGVTAEPCGACEACRGIDAGRFVDLLEVDAASRARVDETRDLMDGVPYAPTVGRCKVYLIDEVHMFSNHSFNALLKVLEEPPDHVRFLLATTEPKRIPVTVLSRCLQFNLRRLTPQQISAQLEHILQHERIPFEAPAPGLLAAAAQGSMRDALSLLDQAIGDGGGELRAAGVQAMLGTIEQADIEGLLRAVIDGDGPALLAESARVAELQVRPSEVLSALLTLLQRIAVCQAAAAAPGGARTPPPGSARDFAARIPPETVQLLYQLALTGRRDLPLCPDPQGGLEMCLVRMLVFRPGAEFAGAPQAAPPAPRPVSAGQPRVAGNVAPGATTADAATTGAATADAAAAGDDDAPGAAPAAPPIGQEEGLDAWWRALVARLEVSPGARQLALHSVPIEKTDTRLELALDESKQPLLSDTSKGRLQQALDKLSDAPLQLHFQLRSPSRPTPAEHDRRLARRYLEEDPNVRQMQERYEAQIGSARLREDR